MPMPCSGGSTRWRFPLGGSGEGAETWAEGRPIFPRLCGMNLLVPLGKPLAKKSDLKTGLLTVASPPGLSENLEFGSQAERGCDTPWGGTRVIVSSRLVITVGLVAVGAICCGSRTGRAAATEKEHVRRASDGLQAYYDFSDSSGAVVKDRSGKPQPADLRIANLEAVGRGEGSLQLRGRTLIQSAKPPTRIVNAIRRSGEITVEAWIRPANISQSGPARIVTFSKNSTARNFTLGQEGDKFDARLRTTSTSSNGLPSLSTKPKSAKSNALTHVVYTRNRTGRARIFINGRQREERDVAGSTSNWDSSFQLALGNEQDRGRPWRGTYHLVAIYSRDLTAGEIERHYEAGPQARGPQLLVQKQEDPRQQHFEMSIAPLLAQHCLECHDSASKEGGLDLSRKATALVGGDSGPALLPGKATASPLWEAVESDEMPAERTALSAQEKELLRKWIDDGATWSLDRIDPAVYVHNTRVSKNWLRRLTVPEYIQTVHSTLGIDIAEDARKILPQDVRADGFSNTAYNLNVDLKHVDAYARLAQIIVDRMDVVKFAAQFSKSQKFTDKDMGKLISKMGKWILRGPVEEHEIIAYRGISTTVASTSGSFEEAVSYILEAMLQSPRFIYRIEDQRGDGTVLPVSEYELASRMSYIVWGSSPDQELIRAADEGELYELDQVRAQVRRMLDDPRAVEHSLRFITEWLNLSRLGNLRPDPEKFPGWEAQIADDMRKETLAFFHDVVWKQNRPLSDLLNAQLTYVTPRLAAHYGMPARDDSERKGDGAELMRYDLAAVPGRGGLFTHGSVLTVGGDEASTVTRGLFVMRELLRGVVKDPPPCVDTRPIATKPGLTKRAIALERIGNAACGGCHSKFEPLAFGLEKFDGLGTYHEKDEHGNDLRDDGEILFPGEAESVSYKSSAELMDLLAGSQRVRQSITWKLTQFALGRPLVAADAASVAAIHKASQDEGGTYRSLITAIVTSDLVRMARTETEAE